jgi:septal ring factor EnvC (AmiA/AmiB activator)
MTEVLQDEFGNRYQLIEDAEEETDETDEDSGDFDSVLKELEGLEDREPTPESDLPQPPSWVDPEGWDPELALKFKADAEARRKEIEESGALAGPDLETYDDLVYTQSDLAGFDDDVLQQKLDAKLLQIEDTLEEAAQAKTEAKRMRLERRARAELARHKFNIE